MRICLRRREFSAGLGGVAAWPLAALAQQGERVRRIGALLAGDENSPEVKTNGRAFTQALADLGWTDGRNVRIDRRWGGADANRIQALAQELVGLQPDIIMTSTTSATLALQRETRTIRSSLRTWPTPLPAASSRGSTSRAGTSPASPPWKPRWEASGLNCYLRSRPGSRVPPSCLILTRLPHRPLCPHLRRRPRHSRLRRSLRPFIAT